MPGRSTFRRTPLQALAAGFLALVGGMTILYAGFLPIPPFSDQPIPVVLQLLGVAGLAAAVGVFLGQGWGRALGVAVVVVSLALTFLRAAAEASGSSAAGILVGLVISVAPAAIVLWILLRRWPART
jgi:hypothetical protein